MFLSFMDHVEVPPAMHRRSR